MHEEVFSKLLNRPADSHKYQYGHALVIGGSPGMVGAPLLAGLAALKTGAGLVTIAAPVDVTDKLERRVKEIMTLALPADDPAAAIAAFIEDRKVSVLVIGPGLSAAPATRSLLKHLLDSLDLPMVIDGGALSALQGHTGELDQAASGQLVLTPHAGEFRRLLGHDLPPKRPELKPLAAAFAKKHGAVLALKGEPTYVAGPDGQVYENPTGNPGLATAGTGDVLSGVIAGIVAQGIEIRPAAEAAVYLHGLAGDLAAKVKTQPGMIAGDVIDFLPAALKQVASKL
jgi:NAD(P)H-hydrate epimerase